jgi:HSP20 family protein
MTLLKFKQAPGSQAFPAFNDIFDLFDNSIHAGFRSWNTPAVNILNTKEGYELQVAAPGMKKEDFRVSVDGDQLTISAEKKEEKQTDEKFTHREFRFSTFSRKFTLPENVNVEQINASYENGVLQLVLPLMEAQKAKTKEITIA